MEKWDNMQEQMVNKSKETETLQKNNQKMQQSKYVATEIQSASCDVPPRWPSTAEENNKSWEIPQ
jgi:hypothetical protein